MIKKIFILMIIFISTSQVFAEAPVLNCVGLPGCKSSDKMTPSTTGVGDNIGMVFITNIIGQTIQYIAVIAVITLIISGILYLISAGEEEKTKKAKTWIIGSLSGVFVSISAWGIINMLNNFAVDNIFFSSNSNGLSSLQSIFIWVKDSLTGLLLLISVGVFLFIGIRLGLARGNPEEFKKAITQFVYAVVGIFVVAFAWAAVVLISGLNL